MQILLMFQNIFFSVFLILQKIALYLPISFANSSATFLEYDCKNVSLNDASAILSLSKIVEATKI